MSGKDLLIRLRRRGDSVPVMMLTAHGSIDDKVDCFAAGADDYVVKPFDARELVARIKEKAVSLVCGDLHYVFDTRGFTHNGVPLTLRRREHAILEVLMLRQGKTVSKTMLVDGIFSPDEAPSGDAIDIYIHRLRKHLAGTSAMILTLRGFGYILRERDDL